MNFSQQMPFPMQQSGGLTQSQASVMPCMYPSLSPTQIPGSQQMFMPPTYTGSAPPSWLSDLINDVKQIKVSLEKLDKIERTVNSISLKVHIQLWLRLTGELSFLIGEKIDRGLASLRSSIRF